MRRYTSTVVLFAILLTWGCGKKGPSIVVYPVTVTVTYDGKPVAGATVSYIVPDNADAPRSSGLTDDEGKFSLKTYVSPKELLAGAPPGDYTVVVLKVASESLAGSREKAPDLENMTPQERSKAMIKMMGQANPQAPVKPAQTKYEVPEKYTQAATSDLKATVLSGENPPAEIKLKD
ncbi:MAG: carboxypeptidase-like regulatory domain-containing protein [Pirellulales bacterium]